MASSTGEDPRTSQIAANATPMVSMEAKMFMATGHEHCQQMKDMLNKADPTTMVVVMASSTQQTSTPKPRSPVMDPRLLWAACSGSFQELESLLNAEDHQASSKQKTIGSSTMHRSSDDEEAFLRESFLHWVTVRCDTLLHVVATHGDCDDFLRKARLVHTKAENLLFVQNNRGDTPLHCAARVGRPQMLSLLIDLAKGQDTNALRMKALLETANKNKGTALHEAVCSGNNDTVKLLMAQHPELASFPKEGTSPLYLAILLEKKVVAETLYEMSAGVLSYSGPNGQNALHAAVLQGKGLTEMVLGWNSALTIQQDDNGSTPLHLAASVARQRRSICLLLLKANPDALFQSDNYGSFPTHVAASIGARFTIRDFLKESPSCVGLCDARGRTFIHVMSVKQIRWPSIEQVSSWILNIQDNDGNTALHLAVQSGSLGMVCSLLCNREVQLNLTNDKGETPLDIARDNFPKGLANTQNREVIIHLALIVVGAKHGCRKDYLEKNDIVQSRQDDKEQMEQVKEGTQILCIGSVLIATVAFGAAFAMHGGYRADDHTNGGAPTLAGRYTFDAFTLANALAFTFSAMATVSLMTSGSPLYNLRIRMMNLSLAFSFMSAAVTSLAAAFALGTYMLLAPVAHEIAIAVSVMSSLIYLYQNLDTALQNTLLIEPLCRRMGYHGKISTFLLEVFTFVSSILFNFLVHSSHLLLAALSHICRKMDVYYMDHYRLL